MTVMDMLAAPPALERWRHIIEAEFREMPGLHLTKAQVRRMWSLDVVTCDAVLDVLERDQFLTQTTMHDYVLFAGSGRP
jgi:hypothetical protein